METLTLHIRFWQGLKRKRSYIDKIKVSEWLSPLKKSVA